MVDSEIGVFEMNALRTFRSKLGWLKFQRVVIRWQTALCSGLQLAIVALFVLLLLDYAFRPATFFRAILICSAIAGVLWRAVRNIAPTVLHRESIVDIAIMLEQTHDVESDLVAALQFDSSDSAANGSRELQQAVVDQATRLTGNLDASTVVPQQDARWSSRLALVAVMFVGAFWFALPNYANAFWNRLCLGDATYPTRTNILEVAINGRAGEARVVEGEPILFRVHCSGVTPREGIATLRGVDTGDSTTVILNRIDENDRGAFYSADGPRLNEPVEVSLQIGDARTTQRHVSLIRRPIIELTIQAVAPDYMRREPVQQQEHFIEVMEGSTVTLSVRCANEKRLVETHVELETGDLIAMNPVDERGIAWQLADAPILERIVEDVSFRVTVVDEDGLGTLHAIKGEIRIKRDRPPTGSVSTSLYAIRPDARPTIHYTIEDDFGISSIVLHARRAAKSESDAVETKVASFEIALSETIEKTLHGVFAVELSQLELVEHDKLLVWIEATDDRGSWPGVSTLSDAIELNVMDQRGVLDEILRTDDDAERMLTDLIEKELGLEQEEVDD
jgi:hypothetical protein